MGICKSEAIKSLQIIDLTEKWNINRNFNLKKMEIKKIWNYM